MWPFAIYFSALIIINAIYWIYNWRHPKCKGILPPGSSGLPLIGESLELLRPYTYLGTPPFIVERVKKFGPIFRTNIAGAHVVVSTDLEVNNYIFQNDGDLVERWLLGTFDRLLFDDSSSEVNDNVQYFRGLLLRLIGIDQLKQKLLPQMEELAVRTLKSWSSQHSTDVKSSISEAFLEIGSKILFSCDPNKSKECTNKFGNLIKGITCLPLDIPGTMYHSLKKDKEYLRNMLLSTIKERISSPEIRHGDFLDILMEEMRKKKVLTEVLISQGLVGLTFGTFETTASILALALNFLLEHPAAFRELTAEHEGIVERREKKSSPITWDEYKSMSFTRQVIKETLRMWTPLPGVLRRAKKDVNVKGYTVPKGWAILAVNIHSHYNPVIFNNPHEFNPWRWKDPESDFTKNYNPFGGGKRQCAGAEYSRVLISIFFHVLVTNYRLEKIGGGDIVQNPLLQFKNDLRIKVIEK